MQTYAIVEIGGTQFRVSKDDVIDVNKIAHEEGYEVKLNNVLMLCEGKTVDIGKPYLKNVTVICEIVGQKRSPKVIAFKYRKRKSSKFKKGHRQDITLLKIKDIEVK